MIVAVVLCLATGCASRPEAFEPMAELAPESDFVLSYSGGLSARQLLDDLPVRESTQSNPDVVYAVEVRFLRAGPEGARRMFGDRAIEIGASSLPASHVTEELLAQGTLVSAPRLSVFENQSGTVRVSNEIAYVSGFAIQGESARRVADPIVDIAHEGLLVELSVVAAGESKLSLSVGVAMSEIVRPIQSQRVRVYGAEMEIQVPVTYTQQISASGEISEDRVLVLTGIIGRDNAIYTVLISGRRTSIDESTPEGK